MNEARPGGGQIAMAVTAARDQPTDTRSAAASTLGPSPPVLVHARRLQHTMPCGLTCPAGVGNGARRATDTAALAAHLGQPGGTQ